MASTFGYPPRAGVIHQAVKQTGTGTVTQPAGSTPYVAGDYIITIAGVQSVIAGAAFERIFDVSNNYMIKGDL